jgi:hypothetical protein
LVPAEPETLQAKKILLLAALSRLATLARLLVRLIGLLCTALLTTTLAALLVLSALLVLLSALILIVLGHGYLQCFVRCRWNDVIQPTLLS